MTTPIEQQIVIAVSSRALFNLESEHHIFEEQGVEAYRAWQVAHANEPLEPGTAFPFIQKSVSYTHLTLPTILLV